MTEDDPITKRQGRYLPHWTRCEAMYSVTFRLADALPPSAMIQLQERIQAHDEIALSRFEQLEGYLDAGHGSCFLQQQDIASLSADAIRFFDAQRYRLVAWCIMPNHIHVIVHPHHDWTLSDILHSWKSFTAQRANQFLGRSGIFWQEESYDHIIRSEDELRKTIAYVWHNPDAAGISDWPWRWKLPEDELQALIEAPNVLRWAWCEHPCPHAWDPSCEHSWPHEQKT